MFAHPDLEAATVKRAHTCTCYPSSAGIDCVCVPTSVSTPKTSAAQSCCQGTAMVDIEDSAQRGFRQLRRASVTTQLCDLGDPLENIASFLPMDRVLDLSRTNKTLRDIFLGCRGASDEEWASAPCKFCRTSAYTTHGNHTAAGKEQRHTLQEWLKCTSPWSRLVGNYTDTGAALWTRVDRCCRSRQSHETIQNWLIRTPNALTTRILVLHQACPMLEVRTFQYAD